MIIGIDGNEANVERRVGVGEYAFELLMQFSKSQISNLPDGKAGPKFQIYLKDQPRNELPQKSENWYYRVIGPRRFWTQIALPIALFKDSPRPDVFFTPTHYAPRWSPVPTVISIMDLSFLHFPEMFKKSDLYQLRNWTRYSVKKAKKILTISQASKNDIIKYYQVKSEKVVVTSPGIKQIANSKLQIANMDKIKKKYGISGEYILFVGTLQPRKNLVRLIEAFSRIIHPRGAPQAGRQTSLPRSTVAQRHLGGGRMDSPEVNSLVVVGKPGWLYEEIYEAPKKFGVKERVKFLDFVPDGELPILYKNAICFILPSLYEGFGLPVLEAMANGCPVITSNVSSLPEAGGEAALYVDPTDVNDMVKNLELIINNSELREQLIKKGYKQVKKFSWEKTARKTLKVLEEVGS